MAVERPEMACSSDLARPERERRRERRTLPRGLITSPSLPSLEMTEEAGEMEGGEAGALVGLFVVVVSWVVLGGGKGEEGKTPTNHARMPVQPPTSARPGTC